MTRCSAIGDFNEDRSVVDASRVNLTTTMMKSFNEIHDETMAQLRASSDAGAYLDGCRIYVVEYEKCDELKRELNKSGAVRLNQLCEGVTHVIVTGQKIPSPILAKINELEST